MARAQVAVSAANGSVFIWEPLSLTILAQFQDLELTYSQGITSIGAGLLAVQAKKTLLNYYKYGSALGLPYKKSTLGDRLKCVAGWRDLVAAGTSTGGLRIWDGRTGEMVASLAAHATAVTALDLSERVLLTGGEDGLVLEFHLSDLYSGLTQPRFTYSHHSMTVTRVAVWGERRYSVGLDYCVGVLEAGEVRERLDCASGLTALAVDSLHLYAGGSDGTLYQLKPSASQWKWQHTAVSGLSLLADGRHLLVAADCVYLLATESGERLKSFKMHKGPVACLLLIDRPAALTSIEDNRDPFNPLERTVNAAFRHPLLLKGRIPAPDPVQALEDKTETPSNTSERLLKLNQWMYSAWTATWL